MLDIRKFEIMAKLELPEPERQWVAGQAEKLLGSFSALESIDTEGVEPLIAVLDTQNALREDVAVKAITREELLSNAPEQYDGYFQVPKTLD
jgi:aspartyl-tRNA(Asn)/glutamyl-tRNA(Gln) amidotransferase subunit C